MSNFEGFFAPAEDRTERRKFYAMSALAGLSLVASAAMASSWAALAPLLAGLAGFLSAYRQWRRVATGYLAADPQGVALVENGETVVWYWGPRSRIDVTRDLPPGVVRLLDVHGELEEGVRTVTLPWHRFRTSLDEVVTGLEAGLDAFRHPGRGNDAGK